MGRMSEKEFIVRRIPFSPPDISEVEIQAVSDALRSGWITTGPRTKEFEEKIAQVCNTERAVCLHSATAAMEMTLRLLGIGPGDEVITSAYTYTASASVIHHVGAKIVLVDTAPDSFHLDPDQIKAHITEKTKAVIPVDIAGVLCDYEAIQQVLEEEKRKFRPANALQEQIGRIVIVADAAHAFGAEREGRPVGTQADFTCFSFHAVKNLTTAEGGAVVWHFPQADDDWIYKQYMLLSLHGQDKDALTKSKAGGWEYDIVAPYFKCNMTDITAALGLAQLDRYPELLQRRESLINQYEQNLADLPVQWLRHKSAVHRSSGHLFLLRLKGKTEQERNALITSMEERGISCNVHYKPLPMLTAYKDLGFWIEDFPCAYEMYRNEMTLPLHTQMSEEDIIYIADTLRVLL